MWLGQEIQEMLLASARSVSRSQRLWWFDNKAMHEAWNHGDQDRLHLIFDMLSATGAAMVARRENMQPA